MTFAAPVPVWGLVVAAAAAVALAVWAYTRTAVPLSPGRRAVLTALRLLSLVLVLLYLLRPVATEPAPPSDTIVPILIDLSRSMRVPDDEGQRRFDRAVALVRDDIVPALSPHVEVAVLGFGERVTPIELQRAEPNQERTEIVEALGSVSTRFPGRALSGVVLVSDGADTTGETIPDAATGLPPVYAVGVGAPRVPIDLEVTSLTAGEAAVTASIIDVEVSVMSTGRGTRPVELRLLEDGRLLQVRRLTPTADGAPVRTVFQVSPKSDVATLYTAEVLPEPEEVVDENNRRSVLVPPPGAPHRLLMVEGAPGYEHSFLKRALLADPGFEVDAVIRKGLNDQGEPTFYVQGHADRTLDLATGYPLTRTALFRYDAVILANIEPTFLRPDQQDATVDFVADRGGGVLLFGPATLASRELRESPVVDLLPLEPSARDQTGEPGRAQTLVVRLTPDGVGHPIMRLGAAPPAETETRWSSMPSLGGRVMLGAPKPGALVLADTVDSNGNRAPLVAVQRFGRGRTAVFTGEAAWRWKMRSPSDDRTYEAFWGQTLRWLAAGARDPVSVQASSPSPAGDVIDVRVTLRDPEYQPLRAGRPVVEVRAPDGETQQLIPTRREDDTGAYTARFRPDTDGVYEIRATAAETATTATTWFLVGGADTEFADPRRNDQVLERLASATGGSMVGVNDADGIADHVMSGIAERAPRVTRELWHGLWPFIAIVFTLSAEWSLRRLWGLR